MKIIGKKDMAAERQRGRAEIDAAYMPRIAEAMGPKFALYQVKALVAGEGNDLFGKPDTIFKKHAAVIDALAEIEVERQAAQALVDQANSSAEIDVIIASL